MASLAHCGCYPLWWLLALQEVRLGGYQREDTRYSGPCRLWRLVPCKEVRNQVIFLGWIVVGSGVLLWYSAVKDYSPLCLVESVINSKAGNCKKSSSTSGGPDISGQGPTGPFGPQGPTGQAGNDFGVTT